MVPVQPPGEEIGGACLKMAGVERGSADGRATPADPPARTFSVVSEKALDDLSSYETLLLDYSKQIDEIEVQLQCGTHQLVCLPLWLDGCL